MRSEVRSDNTATVVQTYRAEIGKNIRSALKAEFLIRCPLEGDFIVDLSRVNVRFRRIKRPAGCPAGIGINRPHLEKCGCECIGHARTPCGAIASCVRILRNGETGAHPRCLPRQNRSSNEDSSYEDSDNKEGNGEKSIRAENHRNHIHRRAARRTRPSALRRRYKAIRGANESIRRTA